MKWLGGTAVSLFVGIVFVILKIKGVTTHSWSDLFKLIGMIVWVGLTIDCIVFALFRAKNNNTPSA